MNEFSRESSREQVRTATEKTRAMTAERATRVSPTAMAEVLSALNDYWDAIDASDLKETSKGIYMSMADNFVRWMRDEFNPGCRSTVYGYPARYVKKYKPPMNSELVGDGCRCGHSAKSHIFPGSTQYGDCHLCECELYNPGGGLKGVPIHPLFAFTEDEFRMMCCAHCMRFRVVPDGVCESCGWDNDNNGFVEHTRPQYCRHSPTKQHEVPSLESSRCRYCLRAISVIPGTHGTQERWESGCDCNDCRSAARQWITNANISPSLRATLREILVFRRNVNELWLTTNTLKKETVRRNIDELARLGVLTEITSGEPNRGIYVFHFERLH